MLVRALILRMWAVLVFVAALGFFGVGIAEASPEGGSDHGSNKSSDPGGSHAAAESRRSTENAGASGVGHAHSSGVSSSNSGQSGDKDGNRQASGVRGADLPGSSARARSGETKKDIGLNAAQKPPTVKSSQAPDKSGQPSEQVKSTTTDALPVAVPSKGVKGTATSGIGDGSAKAHGGQAEINRRADLAPSGTNARQQSISVKDQPKSTLSAQVNTSLEPAHSDVSATAVATLAGPPTHAIPAAPPASILNTPKAAVVLHGQPIAPVAPAVPAAPLSPLVPAVPVAPAAPASVSEATARAEYGGRRSSQIGAGQLPKDPPQVGVSEIPLGAATTKSGAASVVATPTALRTRSLVASSVASQSSTASAAGTAGVVGTHVSGGTVGIGYVTNQAINAVEAAARQLVSGPAMALAQMVGGPVGNAATQFSKGAVAFVAEVAQFSRQMAGLAFDAGAIAASAVSNVASNVEAAFGPNAFWGVPASIAAAVADTSANISKMLTDTPLNAASQGRFAVHYGVYDALSYLNPAQVPAGANDPSITVTAEHPLPVILVNGTIETQGFNWSVGAPALANAGYKVYTFNYGNTTGIAANPFQAIGDVRQSAQELSAEIDKVLAETGAPKVILVGHSQGGGLLPEYYMNQMGGADKVSQLIGIAPSNHGTDLDGIVYLRSIPIVGPLVYDTIAAVAPAAIQQAFTSPFQKVVYGNGDTQPGVQYTTIASTNDEVVTPYTQQALNGPDVTNIVIQNQDPGFAGGHMNLLTSPQLWDDVLTALANNPEANPSPNAAAPTAAA